MHALHEPIHWLRTKWERIKNNLSVLCFKCAVHTRIKKQFKQINTEALISQYIQVKMQNIYFLTTYLSRCIHFISNLCQIRFCIWIIDQKKTRFRVIYRTFLIILYIFFQTNFLKCNSFPIILISIQTYIFLSLKHFNVILFEMCFCFFIICFNVDFHLYKYTYIYRHIFHDI